MVGTIEPRKGYAQVLAAFEKLWSEGRPLRLVIVGKSGWMVQELIDRLRVHSRLGQLLFWLQEVNDADLDRIYEACSCLIAASEGEGFGLPLIEAAQHNLPILARDIPVFREVAAGHAAFFDGTATDSLARTITEWLELRAQNRIPRAEGIPWVTWAQSAERLKAIFLENHWYKLWPESADPAKNDSARAAPAGEPTPAFGGG
jgi:glycosyltransferase involved in cell wall biosynthesis